MAGLTISGPCYKCIDDIDVAVLLRLERGNASVERWMSCLPTMLHACAEADDETSAEKVLTAMSLAGSRQHQSFLAQFNEHLTHQFLGKSATLFYQLLSMT